MANSLQMSSIAICYCAMGIVDYILRLESSLTTYRAEKNHHNGEYMLIFCFHSNLTLTTALLRDRYRRYESWQIWTLSSTRAYNTLAWVCIAMMMLLTRQFQKSRISQCGGSITCSWPVCFVLRRNWIGLTGTLIHMLFLLLILRTDTYLAPWLPCKLERQTWQITTGQHCRQDKRSLYCRRSTLSSSSTLSLIYSIFSSTSICSSDRRPSAATHQMFAALSNHLKTMCGVWRRSTNTSLHMGTSL